MPTYLTDFFGNVSQQLGVFLPRIAGATLILFVGWIIAHLIARTVRLAASKAKLGSLLADKFGLVFKRGSPSTFAGKLAFYIVMVFVLVAFFNSLSLPIVSDPLNAFLKQIFEFAPRLLSAVGLAVIAVVLARLAKEGSRRGLEAIHIDERLASIGNDSLTPSTLDNSSLSESSNTYDGESSKAYHVGSTKAYHVGSTKADDSVQLSKSIPEAAYWIILFLFLPSILGVLQLNGLLEPVQSMFTKVMNYLPNVLGAIVILIAGTFIAKVIRTVVSNLSDSFGANRLAANVGLGETLNQRKLSEIFGVVAFSLVMLPISVATLNTLDIDAVTQPASQILGKITAFIPGFFGACVVLGISYFVGKLVSGVASDFLSGWGFDDFSQKFGVASSVALNKTPSKIAGTSVLVMVMLLATMQALPMMGLDMLAAHLQEFIGFIFQLSLGCVIIAIGIYLANIAAGFIRASNIENADRLAALAQVAIVIFAGATGLQRMGLAPSIVNVAFTALLGALGLAAAIAFGWGGRDAAKRLIDRYIG